MPNCTASPSNCGDVALLNQLDGFNIQPRISIPFDGAIDPSTVNNNTVFLIRIADTFNPTTFNPQIVGINQVVWDTLTIESALVAQQQGSRFREMSLSEV
jgi:hypothetical protein